MSELFFWETSKYDLPGDCPDYNEEFGCRRSSDPFFSALQGITHNFETTDGQRVQYADRVKGTAGKKSYFGILRRDKYGNLLQDAGEKFDIKIVGQNPITGAELVLHVPVREVAGQAQGRGLPVPPAGRELGL